MSRADMPEAGRSGIPKPRRTAYVHEASAADFLRRTSGVMTESGDSPLTVTQVEQVRPGITTSWGKEYYLVLTLSDATVVPARWYIEIHSAHCGHGGSPLLDSQVGSYA